MNGGREVGADPGGFFFSLSRGGWEHFQGSDVFISWHDAAFCD